MRLLRVDEHGAFVLEHFYRDVPPYAILSHTWGPEGDEVIYSDIISYAADSNVSIFGSIRSKKGQINSLNKSLEKKRKGFSKLDFCAKQVRDDKLKYFWIDSCCIDKSSSAELTEAINSMFAWYSDAEVCYVYLEDVDYPGAGPIYPRITPALLDKHYKQFEKSRWFTRGWTLQELLAPRSVEFYNRQGNFIGDKVQLVEELHKITGIPIGALTNRSLDAYRVEDRLSWAKNRQTTRIEDQAYCLQGLFNVHMSAIYGEREHAMIRLRKEFQDRMPPASNGVSDLADEPLLPLSSEWKTHAAQSRRKVSDIKRIQMTRFTKFNSSLEEYKLSREEEERQLAVRRAEGERLAAERAERARVEQEAEKKRYAEQVEARRQAQLKRSEESARRIAIEKERELREQQARAAWDTWKQKREFEKQSRHYRFIASLKQLIDDHVEAEKVCERQDANEWAKQCERDGFQKTKTGLGRNYLERKYDDSDAARSDQIESMLRLADIPCSPSNALYARVTFETRAARRVLPPRHEPYHLEYTAGLVGRDLRRSLSPPDPTSLTRTQPRRKVYGATPGTQPREKVYEAPPETIQPSTTTPLFWSTGDLPSSEQSLKLTAKALRAKELEELEAKESKRATPVARPRQTDQPMLRRESDPRTERSVRERTAELKRFEADARRQSTSP